MAEGDAGQSRIPQCETAEGRLHSLGPDNFRYEMTAREIAWPDSDAFAPADRLRQAPMRSFKRWQGVALLFVALCALQARGAELRPWTAGATPPLALADLEGRVHRLDSYRGSVVLVNFWATWCEPCRDEMPSLQKLKAQLGGKPLVILAVNFGESAQQVKAFLNAYPLDFPVLLDRDQTAAKAWKVRALPASFLVAPDGRVRSYTFGGRDWADAASVAAVSRWFAVRP